MTEQEEVWRLRSEGNRLETGFLCPVCKREMILVGKNKRARSRSLYQFRMKYAKVYFHSWCWDLMMGGEHALGSTRIGTGEVHGA